MIGFELVDKGRIPAFAGQAQPASLQFVNRLHEAGLLTIPAGTQVIRLLPALNLARAQAEEGLAIIGQEIRRLAETG
jgi:acetylornithine/succinyldiaminopimelate/putrescine aminotransferase